MGTYWKYPKILSRFKPQIGNLLLTIIKWRLEYCNWGRRKRIEHYIFLYIIEWYRRYWWKPRNEK